MELPVISNTAPASESDGCASSGCGTAPDALGHLPDHIRAKVQDHPCYSEEAHHYFARMRVAVAPACNIQRNYCNRKYDCSNESRSGVISELLTPEQAIKKVLAVAAEIPQMTVLGIAGPGDPLANPGRTFETFEQLSARAPDIKLCVSTNGLNLPQYVDRIAQHDIDHVTIVINCVDPEAGANIYSWIYWENKRIAGVNYEHLKEVSKIVKAKGAFLHNVMPLIAEPEHGTYYGIMEQPEMLQDLQDACAGDIAMMRHCRQCRADAVGLLGEDRGDEFTLDKIDVMDVDYEAAMVRRKVVHDEIIEKLDAKRGIVKPRADGIPEGSRPVLMAVAGKNGVVAEHFGHAKEFLIYEASPEGVRFMSHRKTELYCGGMDSCGDGDVVDAGATESLLDRNIRILSGCEIVLCSKVGYEPWAKLEAAGIAPNGEHAMEPIEEAVYKEIAATGKLLPAVDSKKVA